MNKYQPNEAIDSASDDNINTSSPGSFLGFERSSFDRFLGVVQENVNGSPVFRMTFRDQHVGNPLIKTFHGGIIASFAEVVAERYLQMTGVLSFPTICSSMTFDYLRPAFAGDLRAEPEVVRAGKRFVVIVVNVFLQQSLVSRGRFIYSCRAPVE